MPLLTFRVSAQGPIVNARIAPAGAPFVQQYPTYQSIQMLLDTGADFTSVDESVLKQWNLNPTTAVLSKSVHGQGLGAAYDLSVDIEDPHGRGDRWSRASMDVVARDPKVFKGTLIQGLIGRDVLDSLVFNYDGLSGFFTLKF